MAEKDVKSKTSERTTDHVESDPLVILDVRLEGERGEHG